jgi:hypothetical protein
MFEKAEKKINKLHRKVSAAEESLMAINMLAYAIEHKCYEAENKLYAAENEILREAAIQIARIEELEEDQITEEIRCFMEKLKNIVKIIGSTE